MERGRLVGLLIRTSSQLRRWCTGRIAGRIEWDTSRALLDSLHESQPRLSCKGRTEAAKAS